MSLSRIMTLAAKVEDLELLLKRLAVDAVLKIPTGCKAYRRETSTKRRTKMRISNVLPERRGRVQKNRNIVVSGWRSAGRRRRGARSRMPEESEVETCEHQDNENIY
jgi:hypothetical protein